MRDFISGYGKPMRLVLKHKTSGKISSSRNHELSALKIESMRLNELGSGAGIVSLLLPKTANEIEKLKKIASIYSVQWVIPRKSNTDRKHIRESILDDILIAQLAFLFDNAKRSKYSRNYISLVNFVNWLKAEIKRKESQAYTLIKDTAPLILEVEHGDRWWINEISRRKKRRVNDF